MKKPRKSDTEISIHAKERAFERYGVVFSKPKWDVFCRTLRNENYAIRLTGHRVACYCFETWFLVVLRNEVVLTFLGRDDADEEDKRILRNDSRYRRTGRDLFRVLSPVATSAAGPVVRHVEPEPLPPNTELPSEVLESAEKLLTKICRPKKKV